MEIIVKAFEQLSTADLYELLRLRTEIFVVEQACAYQEVDDYDERSKHIMGYENDQLVAYARNVEPNTIYSEPSIGRVAVKKEYRGKGYGKRIFKKALEVCKTDYPNQTLKIQAQMYLEEFYKSLGFETISEPYPDWGIWHVDMLFNRRS